MKKNNCYILLTVFFVILTVYFIYNQNAYKPVPSGESNLVTELSHEDIEEVLVKRITYKRNNLRYEKQQEEFEKVLNIFENNKDALNIATHCFMDDDKMTWIFFQLETAAAKFYAKEAREKKGIMTYLMVLRGGMPSFRYSGLLPYLNVKNNRDLEAAVKDLNSDIVYALVDSELAIFTLDQRYFKEGEKINFVYTMDRNDKEYLSEGIHLGDGWTVEIVGYNQHYRDSELENNLPIYPDHVFPYFFLY